MADCTLTGGSNEKTLMATRVVYDGDDIDRLASEMSESLFAHVGSLCSHGVGCNVDYKVTLDGDMLMGVLTIPNLKRYCVEVKKYPEESFLHKARKFLAGW